MASSPDGGGADRRPSAVGATPRKLPDAAEAAVGRHSDMADETNRTVGCPLWMVALYKHKDINAYLHGSVASHKDIQAHCFLQDRRMSVAHSCCGNSACRPCRGHSQGGDDVKKRLQSGIAKDCNIVQ